MVRFASFAARKGPSVAPVDELIEMAYSRRRFIRDSAVATAAVASGALSYGCGQSQTPTPPGSASRVAIVGAGMAGLNTAYKLQKVGIKATIFEGSDRTGGRMFTARNLKIGRASCRERVES